MTRVIEYKSAVAARHSWPNGAVMNPRSRWSQLRRGGANRAKNIVVTGIRVRTRTRDPNAAPAFSTWDWVWPGQVHLGAEFWPLLLSSSPRRVRQRNWRVSATRCRGLCMIYAPPESSHFFGPMVTSISSFAPSRPCNIRDIVRENDAQPILSSKSTGLLSSTQMTDLYLKGPPITWQQVSSHFLPDFLCLDCKQYSPISLLPSIGTRMRMR